MVGVLHEFGWQAVNILHVDSSWGQGWATGLRVFVCVSVVFLCVSVPLGLGYRFESVRVCLCRVHVCLCPFRAGLQV
jgi:hypothetical protein